MTGARLVTTGAVAAFWVLTVVAARDFPGYAARTDVVSTLAGRGSPVAALGVLAILALALAHAAAGAVPRPGRLVPVLLLGAAAATVVVAAFRVSVGAPDDVVDLVHAAGVVGYELLLLAAMLAVADRATRDRRWWLAVVSVVAAVASVLLLARWTGSDPGLWQRLWLGTNLGWLLLVTWTVGRQDTGANGWTATSPAR